jgi:hypothetical protein
MSTPPLRLAIVSTPRSGNTWLRAMLSRLYGVTTAATHELTAADYAAMPAEVVHQIHWMRTPEFVAELQSHGFTVVTVARHPLDTLVSILHFAWYDDDTRHWLLGAGGSEEFLRGASPRSRPFLDYACGPRAAALLAVTADWWQQPGVVSVRYEDMVRDPAGELTKLAAAVGPPRGATVETVVAATTLDQLRRDSTNNHYWKGKPGLWREYLPAAEATEIATAHAGVFARLGYACDPDPGLTAAAADWTWVRHIGPELGETVRGVTAGHRDQMRLKDQHSVHVHGLATAALAERDIARTEAATLRQEVARLTARRFRWW